MPVCPESSFEMFTHLDHKLGDPLPVEYNDVDLIGIGGKVIHLVVYMSTALLSLLPHTAIQMQFFKRLLNYITICANSLRACVCV